jgi:hypothetical protein
MLRGFGLHQFRNCYSPPRLNSRTTLKQCRCIHENQRFHIHNEKTRHLARPFHFCCAANYRPVGGGVGGCGVTTGSAGGGVSVGSLPLLAGCTPGTKGTVFTSPVAASARLIP